MSCNCNRDGNNCGLPSQPNYNNLNKGFVAPKKGCCDCGDDENKICKNGKIVIIDKNHLYPHEGIYLEDKPDGNQILHLTLRPNDYTYIVNFNNTDNFYVTHMFVTYKEDNTNNCNNIYRLYINNQRECNPIEIRIDDNLKQFNNFYVRELDDYINEPDTYKYLKGKFFKLRSMRNLEIEVNKPTNSIRMYCDDNILKNNLKHLQRYIISSIYTDDYSGYVNIELKYNPQSFIIVDTYCPGINILWNDDTCSEVNSELKLFIDYRENVDEIVIDLPIIWVDDNPPEFEIDNLYEISISYINGNYLGVFAKYSY